MQPGRSFPGFPLPSPVFNQVAKRVEGIFGLTKSTRHMVPSAEDDISGLMQRHAEYKLNTIVLDRPTLNKANLLTDFIKKGIDDLQAPAYLNNWWSKRMSYLLLQSRKQDFSDEAASTSTAPPGPAPCTPPASSFPPATPFDPSPNSSPLLSPAPSDSEEAAFGTSAKAMNGANLGKEIEALLGWTEAEDAMIDQERFSLQAGM
jgi:hypothetical protein